jgi:hypothetical protein
MAHRILSLFGGSVCVQNLEPSGIRLSILLKNAEPDLRTLTSDVDATELCLP